MIDGFDGFESGFFTLPRMRLPHSRRDRPLGCRRSLWFAVRRNRRGTCRTVVVGDYRVVGLGEWAKP